MTCGDYLFGKGFRLFFIQTIGSFKIFDDAMPLDILADIPIWRSRQNIFATAMRMDRQLRQTGVIDIEYFSVVVKTLPTGIFSIIRNIQNFYQSITGVLVLHPLYFIHNRQRIHIPFLVVKKCCL